MSKNLCGKSRKKENPYEIWQASGWEWRILKKYQNPENEAKNAYARSFCAVASPFNYGVHSLGDVYVREIKGSATKVYDEAEGLGSLADHDIK